MLPARFTRTAVMALDWLAGKALPPGGLPPHQHTGRRGEEAAYFHLRSLGYVVVARNYRSSRRRGEIDLIAWHKEVLCFVEVKTRTSHDIKPAEAAVDRGKQRELQAMAREYLRHLPPSCQWRFDVLSVYFDHSSSSPPQFELFQDAVPVS
jgi:putative endonuclease